MPDTAAAVFSEAKGLLNDLAGSFYTDTALLPYLNKAYRELQNAYRLHGLKATVEVTGVTNYIANADTITIPADLLRPIEVGERPAGAVTQQFTPVDEKSWEPDQQAGTTLRYWTWREETLYVLPATQNRDVRLRYVKGLATLSGAGSTIGINNSVTALAARTAALAARYIGENPTRADALDLEAQYTLDQTIATAIRQNQGMPTRRKRTRYRVNN